MRRRLTRRPPSPTPAAAPSPATPPARLRSPSPVAPSPRPAARARSRFGWWSHPRGYSPTSRAGCRRRRPARPAARATRRRSSPRASPRRSRPTPWATPATILGGGPSQLPFVVENNNSAGIVGIAFSDAFPAGMSVAPPPASPSTCGGAPTGNTAGSTTFSLTGGAIAAANGTCQIQMNVTVATQGSYANQTSGATSTTTGASPGPRSNIATLTVNLAVPAVAKTFTPATVGTNVDSVLTVTLTNPNAAVVTNVNLTDTYPAGLANSATPNVPTTFGGSVTGAAGGNSLQLVGGSIPASGSCTVSVNVNSATAGSYVNSTGAVTTGNAGTAAAAGATLAVVAPPAITKSFTGPIGPGAVSTLTFTITNPNTSALTGVAFSDTLPTAPDP